MICLSMASCVAIEPSRRLRVNVMCHESTATLTLTLKNLYSNLRPMTEVVQDRRKTEWT